MSRFIRCGRMAFARGNSTWANSFNASLRSGDRRSSALLQCAFEAPLSFAESPQCYSGKTVAVTGSLEEANGSTADGLISSTALLQGRLLSTHLSLLMSLMMKSPKIWSIRQGGLVDHVGRIAWTHTPMTSPHYTVQFVGHVIQDEFTEYHMKVVSLSDNLSWLVRRRYSEFRELHDHLKLKYPSGVPAMPGKKLWGNQDPEFVKQRQEQLQVYMNGILLLEPDCRTRVLQRFLEIKKDTQSGGPAGASGLSGVSTPPKPLASSSPPSAASPLKPISKAQTTERLNAILAELEKNIFDLSATPALIDQTEYVARQLKYAELVAQKVFDKDVVVRSIDRRIGELEKARAPMTAAPQTDNYTPIATEADLVAFFPTHEQVPVE